MAHIDSAHLDPSFVHLNWEGSSAPLLPVEPEDYVYETRGAISTYGDSEALEPVGRFEVTYVDIDQALNDSMSMGDLFDAHGYTSEFFAALFDPISNEFSPALSRFLDTDAEFATGLLILHRIGILPGFRRNGLGLIVMRQLIQIFGDAGGIVGIKPFPLQFEPEEASGDAVWRAKLALPSYPRNARTTTAKLRSYYGRLGFRRLVGTPFMFLPASASLPTVQRLAGRRRNEVR